MNIKEHISNYKIKDYIEDEEMNLYKKGYIDCTVGVNSFIDTTKYNKILKSSKIKNTYTDMEYTDLNYVLQDYWKEIINLNFNNISFGQGTIGCIRGIFDTILNKGSKVLGIAPGFPRIVSEVELHQGIFEYCNLDKENNYIFNSDFVIQKINMSNDYEILYIDNPNNPTGQIIPINEIEIIVSKCQESNIFVIIDEAYGDYMSNNNSAIKLVNKYNDIAVCKSASKAYGLADNRVGYIVSNEQFIKAYKIMALPFPFSELSEILFIHALKESNFLNESLEQIKLSKKYVLEEVEKLKNISILCTSVETPIFTMRIENCRNLKKEFINNKILVESCKEFEGLDESFVRIRISKEYKEVMDVIKIIAHKYKDI